MPRGSNAKREREYEELKDKFKESGRYRGREEEVAARIENKQRAEYGETKHDKKQEREGTNPDRDLPIPSYRHLKIPQIEEKAKDLSPKQIEKVERYEKQHKNRKGAVAALENDKKTRKRKKAA